MKHGENIFKTALVDWVSLCLMGLIASSCNTVGVGNTNLDVVTGTVLDERNEPAVWASVSQKGNSKNQVSTDIDGRFKIFVPKGAKVKVSYVGCKDVIVNAQDGMSVNLESDGSRIERVKVVRVTGTVLDDNNEPLISWTVQQNDNPENTVFTDIDGHFTICVPAGALLRVLGDEEYYDNVVEAEDGMTIILNHNPNYKEPILIAK